VGELVLACDRIFGDRLTVLCPSILKGGILMGGYVEKVVCPVFRTADQVNISDQEWIECHIELCCLLQETLLSSINENEYRNPISVYIRNRSLPDRLCLN
jgi:transcriptional regulator